MPGIKYWAYRIVEEETWLMKDQRETREATTALMTRVQYQGLVYGAGLIAAYNKLNIT